MGGDRGRETDEMKRMGLSLVAERFLHPPGLFWFRAFTVFADATADVVHKRTLGHSCGLSAATAVALVV